MAENLTRRGMAVTLLEMTSQVMPPADPEMVAPIEQELRQQGVDLRLGDAVAGFEPGTGPFSGQKAHVADKRAAENTDLSPSANDTITVLTKNGERLPAEVVILSVGVKPDTRLAREAGLEIGPTGGIRVDDQMRTSDPAIFAVGDAVEVREFITGLPALVPLAGPANRQGRIAADVICGRDAHFRGSQATAVVGVFELTLAMTGATEKSLRRTGIPFEKSYTHSTHHASYYPGAERITTKLLFSPESGRVLGAQAVGRQGVEKRIDVIAMAIQMKATVFDLEEAELCYAPQYGSAKDPVNMAGFVAGNILRGDVQVGHWDEWKRRQAAGQTPVTLDVRPPTAVAAGVDPRHDPHSPWASLRARLDELPRDREIWVHCAVGQTSYNAVRLLKQHGFQVRNLSGGIASYKVEK